MLSERDFIPSEESLSSDPFELWKERAEFDRLFSFFWKGSLSKKSSSSFSLQFGYISASKVNSAAEIDPSSRDLEFSSPPEYSVLPPIILLDMVGVSTSFFSLLAFKV